MLQKEALHYKFKNFTKSYFKLEPHSHDIILSESHSSTIGWIWILRISKV